MAASFTRRHLPLILLCVTCCRPTPLRAAYPVKLRQALSAVTQVAPHHHKHLAIMALLLAYAPG